MPAAPPTPAACPSCGRPARVRTGSPWRPRCAGCGHRLALDPADPRLRLVIVVLWAGMILGAAASVWLRIAGLPWPLFAASNFVGVQWIALAALRHRFMGRFYAILATGLGLMAILGSAAELAHALKLTGAAAGCVCLLAPAWAVGLITLAFWLERRL